MACGTETLTDVNPGPIVQTFVIRKDPDTVVTFEEVDDLFILTSSKCPITKYSVTSSSGQPLSANALKTIQMDEKERTITILNNIFKDLNVDLLLHVETAGGVKASKEVKLAFTENTAPKFKSKPKKISIEVIGDDIKKKKKDVFEYTSESATDAEKDKITFKFSGLNKIKCNCVTIKQVDDKFEVKIDKKRITKEDVGTYKIKVEIEDASYYYSKNKASEELEIQIEYQPETEVEKTAAEKGADSNNTAAANTIGAGDPTSENSSASDNSTATGNATADSNDTAGADSSANTDSSTDQAADSSTATNTGPAVVLNPTTAPSPGQGGPENQENDNQDQPIIKPVIKIEPPKKSITEQVLQDDQSVIKEVVPPLTADWETKASPTAVQNIFSKFKKNKLEKLKKEKTRKSTTDAAQGGDTAVEVPEEDEEANAAPEVETGKLSREGALPIKMSAPCEVPDIFSTTDANGNRRLYIQNFIEHPVTGKRQLVGVAELDVTRDVVSLDFVTNTDTEANPIGYYLSMQEWTPTGLGIQINYTDPLMIGKGDDQVMTTLRNPDMFISKASGKSVPKDKATSVEFSPP